MNSLFCTNSVSQYDAARVSFLSFWWILGLSLGLCFGCGMCDELHSVSISTFSPQLLALLLVNLLPIAASILFNRSVAVYLVCFLRGVVLAFSSFLLFAFGQGLAIWFLCMASGIILTPFLWFVFLRPSRKAFYFSSLVSVVLALLDYLIFSPCLALIYHS